MTTKQYWLFTFALRRGLTFRSVKEGESALAVMLAGFGSLSEEWRRETLEEIRDCINRKWSMNADGVDFWRKALPSLEAIPAAGTPYEIGVDGLRLAFLYALGRNSTAPSIVSDELLGRWASLPADFRAEVRAAIQASDTAGDIGLQCDRNTWFRLFRGDAQQTSATF